MADLPTFKLCFLAGTLGQGGAERQLYLAARILRELGAQVHVLSLTKGEFWEKPLQRAGIPVSWVGQSRNKVRRILSIRKMLKTLKPDVCQSQHFFTNLYAAIACKGLPVQGIGAVRSNLHLEMTSRHPFLSRRSITWPHIIFANSQHAIHNASHYQFSEDRFRYFPNILEVSDFPQVKPSLKNTYRILGVGRLVALKRWDVFLEVLSALRDRGYSVEGVLVGDGPEREALVSRANQLELLPGKLTFTGAVPDVRPHYAMADLLLATSSLEGTPNTVMEAMACGLPVVSTRVGDVPNMIQDGVNGFLNEAGDVKGLRDHCVRLLTSFDLRRTMGHAARQFIQNNHSSEVIRETYQSLYKDLLP